MWRKGGCGGREAGAEGRLGKEGGWGGSVTEGAFSRGFGPYICGRLEIIRNARNRKPEHVWSPRILLCDSQRPRGHGTAAGPSPVALHRDAGCATKRADRDATPGPAGAGVHADPWCLPWLGRRALHFSGRPVVSRMGLGLAFYCSGHVPAARSLRQARPSQVTAGRSLDCPHVGLGSN